MQGPDAATGPFADISSSGGGSVPVTPANLGAKRARATETAANDCDGRCRSDEKLPPQVFLCDFPKQLEFAQQVEALL